MLHIATPFILLVTISCGKKETISHSYDNNAKYYFDWLGSSYSLDIAGDIIYILGKDKILATNQLSFSSFNETDIEQESMPFKSNIGVINSNIFYTPNGQDLYSLKDSNLEKIYSPYKELEDSIKWIGFLNKSGNNLFFNSGEGVYSINSPSLDVVNWNEDILGYKMYAHSLAVNENLLVASCEMNWEASNIDLSSFENDPDKILDYPGIGYFLLDTNDSTFQVLDFGNFEYQSNIKSKSIGFYSTGDIAFLDTNDGNFKKFTSSSNFSETEFLGSVELDLAPEKITFSDDFFYVLDYQSRFFRYDQELEEIGEVHLDPNFDRQVNFVYDFDIFDDHLIFLTDIGAMVIHKDDIVLK